MTHASFDARRRARALAPALAALSLTLAPAALAAETGTTTATATFSGATCAGGKHVVNVSVKNPSPSSATFTIRVDGPSVATPNTVTVPAYSTNGAQLTLPADATRASATDSSGTIIGSGSVSCDTSSSSSTSSDAASDSSGTSSSTPSSGASSSAPAEAPQSSDDGSPSSTTKYLGIGLAGVGILLALTLLYREFK